MLDILTDPTVLTISIIKHIEDIKFTAAQLEPYENSRNLKTL
jgi:hypothetical protein